MTAYKNYRGQRYGVFDSDIKKSDRFNVSSPAYPFTKLGAKNRALKARKAGLKVRIFKL